MTTNLRDRTARRGYLILGGLILAALLIFNLHIIRDALRPKLDIVALLPEAPGIRLGSSVWIEGMKAGRVTGVEVVRDNDSIRVAIDLRLEGRARAVVTRESDVRAVRRRVIGEPAVLLAAGPPGTPAISDGDTLRGRLRMSPEMLLDRAGELPAHLAALQEEASVVLDMVERRRGDFDYLAERLDDLAIASNALARDLEGGSLAPLLSPDGLPARIRQTRERLDAVTAATTRAVERYTGEDAPLAASAESIRARAALVNQALADLEARMEEGPGFIARVQQDTALQVAVRGISEQMDSIRAEAFSLLWRMFRPF